MQYNTNTTQYNTIQYNTIQNNTIQYNAIQYKYNTIQIQYKTIQNNTIQYNAIQYKYNTIQIHYNTCVCMSLETLCMLYITHYLLINQFIFDEVSSSGSYIILYFSYNNFQVEYNLRGDRGEGVVLTEEREWP